MVPYPNYSGAFLFRLAFGLCWDFRIVGGDELQIYFIGLKFLTTGGIILGAELGAQLPPRFALSRATKGS